MLSLLCALRVKISQTLTPCVYRSFAAHELQLAVLPAHHEYARVLRPMRAATLEEQPLGDHKKTRHSPPACCIGSRLSLMAHMTGLLICLATHGDMLPLLYGLDRRHDRRISRKRASPSRRTGSRRSTAAKSMVPYRWGHLRSSLS